MAIVIRCDNEMSTGGSSISDAPRDALNHRDANTMKIATQGRNDCVRVASTSEDKLLSGRQHSIHKWI